jgi:hypothetical protein
MRIKYNRVSTLAQTGNRFEADTEKYDLTLLDKISRYSARSNQNRCFGQLPAALSQKIHRCRNPSSQRNDQLDCIVEQ